MEYTNMDDFLIQLERLIEEIHLQINDLDRVLRAEIEMLQSQINNLRN
ncbi:MAG: hypothetical protein LBR92_03700 [Puniceicoccales bacterium]|nr:hypothetical protein [Puniceicoccales bacterium]